MKRQILFSNLILLISSIALGSQEIQGVLDHSVQLQNDEGETVTVGPGPVTFILQSKSLLWGGSEFSLRSGVNTIRFSIPRNRFDNSTDARVPASETGQPLGITSRREAPKMIDNHLETGTASCQKAGVCYACAPGVTLTGDTAGQYEMSCGLKYSLSCPDEQDALYRVSKFETDYAVDFYTPSSNSPVAHFEGKAGETSQSRLEKTTSACGEHEVGKRVVGNLIEGQQFVQLALNQDPVVDSNKKASTLAEKQYRAPAVLTPDPNRSPNSRSAE